MSQFYVGFNPSESAVTSVTGSNGVTASPTTGAVVVSGINATTSTVGVASFNPADFTVSLGGQVSTISSGDLHVARFIVSAGGSTNGANYTTISSAYAAAIAVGGNQTVFIQPGIYTENITLSSGINLTAFNCDAQSPNVTIIGKLSASGIGSTAISGINLQTNGDFCVAVTGSSATVIDLLDCNIDVKNNNAISFTSSSSSSLIRIFNCTGNIDTIGIAYFSHSGVGALSFVGGNFRNDGNSTTANTLSGSGQLNFYNNLFSSNITTSSTSTLTVVNGQMYGAIICGGTGSNEIIESNVSSGSSSAISVGTGATLILSNSSIDSTNTNAITGLGTIKLAGIVFNNISSKINTSTITALQMNLGKYEAPGQPSFNAYASGNITNVTGDGTNYTIIFDTLLFQQGSNFNTSTGVFTAPTTGIYSFCGVFGVYNTSVAHNDFISYLNISGTNSGAYILNIVNPGTVSDVNHYLFQSFSYIMQMNAGDTASLSVYVSGSTKTVGIYGAQAGCTFCGQLIA